VLRGKGVKIGGFRWPGWVNFSTQEREFFFRSEMFTNQINISKRLGRLTVERGIEDVTTSPSFASKTLRLLVGKEQKELRVRSCNHTLAERRPVAILSFNKKVTDKGMRKASRRKKHSVL